MNIVVEVKNYRCFPDSSPARVELGDGFTALVGANNSGKSSLLRLFYEFRSIFQQASTSSTLHPAIVGTEQAWHPPPSVLDSEEVFSNRNDRDIQVRLTLEPSPTEAASLPPNSLNIINFVLSRSSKRWTASFEANYGQSEKPQLRIDGAPNLRTSNRTLGNLTLVFHGMSVLSRALYIGSFRNAINVGSNQDYFDMSIGEAFIAKWRTHKTGALKKNNEAIHRLTDDVRKIFGLDQLEINPSEDGKTLKLMVNRRSYNLGELGSGLTQFVLVLANVAIRQPSIVLIDEPELNLHPSLQLDFLTTLSSYADLGVAFATHSIGLARASANRIYVLRKQAEGISKIGDLTSMPSLSEFLGELSFSGYRELGFKKVLLVEGKTDVPTFQQFLRTQNKDHGILLLPLWGKTLINDSSEAQLAEITRISDDIFAVIDSERAGPDAELDPARAKFVEICRKLKINCHVLQRRATENYLSDKAVKEVKGANFRALAEHEKLSDVSPSWSKADNWRIARRMDPGDLESTDLGVFLAKL